MVKRVVVVFLAFILIFSISTVILADSFKDSLKNSIGKEIEVVIKDVPNSYFLIGYLSDVQDDYIKITSTQVGSKGKVVFTQIENIAYFIILKDAKE